MSFWAGCRIVWEKKEWSEKTFLQRMPPSHSNSRSFWCSARCQIINVYICTDLQNFGVTCWQKTEDCLGSDTRTGMENHSLLVTLVLGIWKSLTETTQVSYFSLMWGSKYGHKSTLVALPGDCNAQSTAKELTKAFDSKEGNFVMHVNQSIKIISKHKRKTWEIWISLSNFTNYSSDWIDVNWSDWLYKPFTFQFIFYSSFKASWIKPSKRDCMRTQQIHVFLS